MFNNNEISKALELCGFMTGDRQESRLMNLLSVILRLQTDPPIPLSFADIYEQLLKDEPVAKLTKAWVHRVLKALVETQLVRVENPSAHRKKYIADVNTVMAGLEQIKSDRIHTLEAQQSEISKTLEAVTELDCGVLAQQYVRTVTGTQQKISSRIVRGVDELHRVLKYNMLDVAKKGDTIRATALWIEPFADEGIIDRTVKFIEAASRGADVRYMVSADAFRLDNMTDVSTTEKGTQMIHYIDELRKSGVKFDVRIYDGPKTYNQVSLNTDNMVLIIAEDPVTATWITRDFNPDLIDNAVKAFDRDWKKTTSFFEIFGAEPGALISKIVKDEREEPEE